MLYRNMLFCLCLSAVTTAETSEKCNFEINCTKMTPSFSLEFHSPSKDCTDDNTTVRFKNLKTEQKIDIKPAWYFEIDNIGNVESKCSSTTYLKSPVFSVAKNLVLFFTRKSGRPSWDQIDAHLLDSATGKLIDSIEMGRIKGTWGVLKTKKGYKMQIVKDFLKEMNCDCDAAFTSDWMEIWVDKNKIQKHWASEGIPSPSSSKK